MLSAIVLAGTVCWLGVTGASAQPPPPPATTPGGVTDPAPAAPPPLVQPPSTPPPVAPTAPATPTDPPGAVRVPPPPPSTVSPSAPVTLPPTAPSATPIPESPAAPYAPTPAPVVTSTPQAPAPASGWAPVFTGSYFTRYELRAGYDDLNVSSPSARQRFLEGDSIYYRIRFGIGTGLIDLGSRLKVGLQFTPQATGTFGNLTTNANAPNTIVDANLGIHEGYLRVAGPMTRFDAGRFELNYGDALILGNLDWNEIGRSFDGVRARIASSPTSAWLDLFATLIDEGRPDFPRGGVLDQRPGIGLGDIYFVGAYAGLGPAIAKGLELDLYVLTRAWAEAKELRAAPGNASSPLYRREKAAEATFGLRAKQRIAAFDYRFEGGLQAGTRPGAPPMAAGTPAAGVADAVDVLAYHADLELGVSFAGDKLRIGLEGIYASGNDPTTRKNEGWDELFPTAHKFLGLSDVFAQGGIKRTNVASGVLHLTAAPSKMLILQVDGHIFARPEAMALVNGMPGPDGLAGGEVDVGAVVVLAKGLKLRGLYGVFVPDEDLYNDVLPSNAVLAKGADPAHYFELELRYDMLP